MLRPILFFFLNIALAIRDQQIPITDFLRYCQEPCVQFYFSRSETWETGRNLAFTKKGT